MRSQLCLATWLMLWIQAHAQRFDGQYWPCNPMKNLTCPPNPGLNQYSYYMDFTQASPDNIQKDWSTSNYATITYNTKGKNGAEFTYSKRYDAPQLFTNFYIFFGRVDVEMQVAPGTGIISSSVLMSDDFDEIDWEMSGNNFNLAAQYPNGVVQNNYFSKGITGAYDRGQWVPCTNPQTTFHTYSVDWTPSKLDWILDGKVIRTFLAANADSTTHQFPQTPAKIQLGMWAGGDPGENKGTQVWAGGITNLSAAPYTMFVRNVRITNYNPARYYNWTDQSGSWKSIKGLNVSLPTPSSSVSKSSSTTIQPLRTDLPVSPNGHCGSEAKSICKGSLFGECCSFYGYCGNTTEYCGLGCQSAFGQCGAQNPAATTGVTSSASSQSTTQGSVKLSVSNLAASPSSNTRLPFQGQTKDSTSRISSTSISSSIKGSSSAIISTSFGGPRITDVTSRSSSSTSALSATITSLKASNTVTAGTPLSSTSSSKDTSNSNSLSSNQNIASSPTDQILAGISTLTGESHVPSPSSSSATGTSASVDANQPSPTAVPVDKPSWQFCFWWRRWYCYKFQSKRSYPVT
ncbi:concanavalin A-like lectin/glucanase domain-containing protein [Xylariaceae sp. AK1471]|nr:concanavalin A-like lectin/glucanase domain-containing protein [Xylariaceae sp. AK1471]